MKKWIDQILTVDIQAVPLSLHKNVYVSYDRALVTISMSGH